MTLADAFAILFGIATTLVIGFYQFGGSNHTIYLLDALHRVSPKVLAADWFTTQTLQYHALFGVVTRTVWRWVEPAFLIGYLGLVVSWHLAWFMLARLLGGGRLTYIMSVVFVYCSSAGTSLGVYSFLQDNTFLPSNIASVALLCGIVLWMSDRPIAAGLGFGLAGAFHLNYSLIAPLLWLFLGCWNLIDRKAGRLHNVDDPLPGLPWLGRPSLIGSILALVPSGLNVLLALVSMRTKGTPMPFGEFIDLYVRLRHAHHYDPLSWPIAMWIAFAWTIPLAATGAWRVLRSGDTSYPILLAWERVLRAYAFFIALLVVAFVFAGVFFVSERLVQMSLFRFSIYPQLFACIMAAAWICEGQPLGRATRWLIAGLLPFAIAVGLLVLTQGGKFRTDFGSDGTFFSRLNVHPIKIACLLLVVPLFVLLVDRFIKRRPFVYGAAAIAMASLLLLGWGPKWYGLMPTQVDTEYLTVCKWARRTPRDAIFLVPPDEQDFRLNAQRAIVVNYKAVPQLSIELPEWRDRLQSVLGLTDLPRQLPRSLPAAEKRMREIYTALPADYLVGVAKKWNARYVVATRELPELAAQRVPIETVSRYAVYDLDKTGNPSTASSTSPAQPED